MSWQLLAELNVTEDWFYTPATENNIFKFTYLNNRGYFNIAVAQAEVIPGEQPTLFDIQRLTIRPQAEIIEIPKPAFFDDRRLAIRGIPSGQSDVYALNLRIEGVSMPLTTRVSVEFPNFPDPKPPSSAASTRVEGPLSGGEVLLSDDSSSRLGLSIFASTVNDSDVQIGFETGFLASNKIAVVLKPGEYYEVPFNCISEVYGNFASDENSVVVTEFNSLS